MIRGTFQPGNIFNFDDKDYNSLWLYSAQAGGWMYPIWAVSTALPLYVGLQDAGYWYSAVPCILMMYGLCVIGGSLHSAFAFLTALPSIYHQEHADIDGWKKLVGSPAFGSFLDKSQSKVIEYIGVGCLLGYVSVNLASAWIAYVVATRSRQTKFPRWLNAFHPFVTMAWVSTTSYLLPDPWGFYVIGSMGTWGVLILNVGVTYVLRNDETELRSLMLSIKED